jgi:hypothetical protein
MITKSRSLQVLIKELDLIFGTFIKLRDSENGRVKCFICGFSMPRQMAQCGHYIDRDQMPTRYNEMNCNAICQNCNCYDPDHREKYRAKLVDKYGELGVSALETISKSLQKFMRYDLLQMIGSYKVKLMFLKKDKNL